MSEERTAILEAYTAGAIRDEKHDPAVIKELENLGYLRCGISSDMKETIKTTDEGLIYLKAMGCKVDCPKIRYRRIMERFWLSKGQ